MLTFYTNPFSRGRIVRWMLEEVGAPYEQKILGYESSMKAPDYLALNPMGKVPAIVHDGHVVTEGAAICAYLADAFPEAGLAPRPGLARASYYRWMFFGAGPVEAAVADRMMNVAPTPEQQRAVGYGDYDRVLRTLDHAVSVAPYLAGDHFSAADVYVGSQIGFGMQFKTIPPSSALTAYWNRIKDRPARLRAAEIDDVLVAEARAHV